MPSLTENLKNISPAGKGSAGVAWTLARGAAVDTSLRTTRQKLFTALFCVNRYTLTNNELREAQIRLLFWSFLTVVRYMIFHKTKHCLGDDQDEYKLIISYQLASYLLGVVNQ